MIVVGQTVARSPTRVADLKHLAATTMSHMDGTRSAAVPRHSTAKGMETAQLILEQTKNILSKDGFAAISIRKVAERCNISPGHVTYHFQTKEILFDALAKYIFERWTRHFYARIPPGIVGPRKVFVFSIEYMIAENKRPKTMTMLLEMWAMSTHSPAVGRMMDMFYSQMRGWIETLLQDLNPKQTTETRRRQAALITCQIEGLMILLGPNRIPHPELHGLEKEAVAQILRMALAD
jgi:AcrR family transcriptional regulator